MKKYLPFTLSLFLLLTSFAADEPMTKENGTYVINTTSIGQDIEGYAGPTPSISFRQATSTAMAMKMRWWA